MPKIFKDNTTGSGYLTNPVRTILIENDFRTGSYPTNLSTFDLDFKGNRKIQRYDDTNTIVFHDKTNRTFIKILGDESNFSDLIHGQYVGLTGSNGEVRNFEFITTVDNEAIPTEKRPRPSLGVSNTTPVYVTKIPSLTKKNLFQAQTKEHAAYELASAINGYTDLGLKAKWDKDVVIIKNTSGPTSRTLGGDFLKNTFTDSTGSEYSSAEGLQLWARLNVSPTDDSNNAATLSYASAGDTSVSTGTIGIHEYGYANFTEDGIGNSEGAVNIGSSSTWNTILGGGGTINATFAIWARRTSAVGSYLPMFSLGERTSDPNSSNIELRWETSNGRIYFYVSDIDGTRSYWYSNSTTLLPLNTWVHVSVVASITSVSATSTYKLYINGTEVSVTKSGASLHNDPVEISNGYCWIGNNQSEDSGFEGDLAEAAIWNEQLSSTEIAAIYNAYYENITVDTVSAIVTGSIFDNVESKFSTRDTFNNSTSVNLATRLPTNSPFANLNVATPNQLPGLTTNTSNGDVIKGVADLGIHFSPGENLSPFRDHRIDLRTSPFFLEGTSKTLTGDFGSALKDKTSFVIELSSSDGGNPIYYATASAVGTYYPDIAGVTGSGFSYWNTTNSSWQMKYNGAMGISRSPYSRIKFDGVDYGRLYSCRGFVTQMTRTMTGSTQDDSVYDQLVFTSSDSVDEIREKYRRNQSIGQPTLASSFPLGEQYAPTSGQTILMSNYISSPFLIEKITVQFDGTLGYRDNLEKGYIECKNFFILNQTSPIGDSYLDRFDRFTFKEADTYPSFPALQYFNPYVWKRNSGRREIITWSRIGIIREDGYMTPTGSGVSSSLISQDYEKFIGKFEKVLTVSTGSRVTTGSFLMEVLPKLATTQNIVSWNRTYTTLPGGARGGVVFAEINPFGGADLAGTPSGRQIFTSMNSADPAEQIGNINSFHKPDISYDAYPAVTTEEHSVTAPYLVLPTDNLIFGWQNIPLLAGITDPTVAGYSSHPLQDANNAEQTVDKIRNLKITFYGSHVREGKEYHMSSNPPLTSDGIHEVLYGEPVLDQWDVEDFSIMSGSYFDGLYFGNMKYSEGTRGRRGSIIAGDAGTTGSLTRNISLEANAVYYDSMMPPIGEIIQNFAPLLTGSTETINGVAQNALLLSPSVGPSRKLLGANNIFANRTINSKRNNKLSRRPFSRPGGGKLLGTQKYDVFAIEKASPGGTPFGKTVFSGSYASVRGINSKRDLSTAIPGQRKPLSLNEIEVPDFKRQKINSITQERELRNFESLNKLVYGLPKISPSNGGMILFPARDLGSFGSVDECSGFKFGICNIVPTSPVFYFRRNKFGNLRDMLESPPEARLTQIDDENNKNSNMVTSPVKVVFKSRDTGNIVDPVTTNSINLSLAATSSLPFFDGRVSDRNIVVSPLPEVSDLINIETALTVNLNPED